MSCVENTCKMHYTRQEREQDLCDKQEIGMSEVFDMFCNDICVHSKMITI